MEYIYFLCLAICFIICLGNWRIGMYLCILMDVVRDPVRKISEGESIYITVTTSLLWLAVFIGVFSTEGAEMWSAFRRYPSLKNGVVLLVLAILPGACLSVILYQSGYLLAAIGCASYLGPLLGLAIGWVYPRLEKDIYRLLAFYVIVNAVALSGTYLEWSNYEIPGLGGMKNMEWIRHDEERMIKLISGFYRSPDIMGLHAAHVVVFSAILAMRLRGIPQICWSSLAMWGALCVLISGRRKMMGIPLVFLATYLVLSMLRNSRAATRATIALASMSILAAAGIMLLRESSTTNDYQQYAATIVQQGFKRSGIILSDVLETYYQAGFLGDGLGSATQGAYYSRVAIRSNWQEDGVSRIMKELGFPGIFLMIGSIWCFASATRATLRLIPAQDSSQQLQFALLAVVAGNAASFIMSHQQYSGDPMSGLLVLFLFGAALGAPRIYAFREARKRIARPGRTTAEPAELGL